MKNAKIKKNTKKSYKKDKIIFAKEVCQFIGNHALTYKVCFFKETL